MFPYPSLELVFLILDLYPKITRPREIQKEKNKSLPDKRTYEFSNTKLKKENHQSQNLKRKPGNKNQLGVWDTYVNWNRKQPKTQKYSSWSK